MLGIEQITLESQKIYSIDYFVVQFDQKVNVPSRIESEFHFD
jgi:hypothetical protein